MNRTLSKCNLNVNDKAISRANNSAINYKPLSLREAEILNSASQGKTYSEIAASCGITLSTVKFHIGNVVRKLGAKNAKHAIRLATESEMFLS